jgi:hypothetical protein
MNKCGTLVSLAKFKVCPVRVKENLSHMYAVLIKVNLSHKVIIRVIIRQCRHYYRTRKIMNFIQQLYIKFIRLVAAGAPSASVGPEWANETWPCFADWPMPSKMGADSLQRSRRAGQNQTSK